MRRAVGLAALALAACHRVPPPPRPTLTLVATGDAWGQIETCGCHVNPTGGLPRRGGYLAQLRGQGAAPIAVDTGDSLFAPGKAALDATDRRRADLIAQSFASLQYAALAVGEWDLRDGAETLRARAEKEKKPAPAVSAPPPPRHGKHVDERSLKPAPSSFASKSAANAVSAVSTTPTPTAGLRPRTLRKAEKPEDATAATHIAAVDFFVSIRYLRSLEWFWFRPERRINSAWSGT